MMRVTEAQRGQRTLLDLQRVEERLMQLQQQLSSGRRIQQPSDDPTGAADEMRWRSAIASNERYGRTVDQGRSWLAITDTSLGQAGDVLSRARELALSAGSDSETPQSRLAVAEEIGQLTTEMQGLANTKFAGRYIFGGIETSQAPLQETATGWQYVGSDVPRQADLGGGASVQAGVTGELFAPTIATLQRLETALRTNDAEQVRALVGDIDQAQEATIGARATTGALVNRLERAADGMAAANGAMTEQMTRVTDVDFTRAVVEMNTVSNAYQAALGAAARIITPSLVDYLR